MTRIPKPEISAFRGSVYRTFSDWFLSVPSEKFMRLFENPEWMESACSLLGPEIRELAQTFAQELDSDQLTAEFAGLFLVPGPQQTFPFEASYREKRRLNGQTRPGPMLGYTSLEVQRAYLEWGMPTNLGTDELPDHAGVELRFMSMLAEAERLAWERQDESSARLILQAEDEFLNFHILAWFPEWLECVCRRARLAFYKSAATSLRRFLETEKITLDQLCAEPPPAYQAI